MYLCFKFAVSRYTVLISISDDFLCLDSWICYLKDQFFKNILFWGEKIILQYEWWKLICLKLQPVIIFLWRGKGKQIYKYWNSFKENIKGHYACLIPFSPPPQRGIFSPSAKFKITVMSFSKVPCAWCSLSPSSLRDPDNRNACDYLNVTYTVLVQQHDQDLLMLLPKICLIWPEETVCIRVAANWSMFCGLGFVTTRGLWFTPPSLSSSVLGFYCQLTFIQLFCYWLVLLWDLVGCIHFGCFCLILFQVIVS